MCDGQNLANVQHVGNVKCQLGPVYGEKLLDQVKEKINYIWRDAGDKLLGGVPGYFFALGTISDGTRAFTFKSVIGTLGMTHGWLGDSEKINKVITLHPEGT